ncbi:hypothetical protein [Deinococcus sp.]|uniref:hypothetical protein n=1 Tax=Deinococcus sp. TaxID=47478 RepID=UPI0025C26523|nr:hypothetical protein [Deinococcus sp.]
MNDFDARALQMAFDLTIRNTYEGKVGQGYNEARAHDIRRLYNIMCGRSPEEQAAPMHILPAPALPTPALAPVKPKRRKKDDEGAGEPQ